LVAKFLNGIVCSTVLEKIGFEHTLNSIRKMGFEHMLNSIGKMEFERTLNSINKKGFKHMLNSNRKMGFEHMPKCHFFFSILYKIKWQSATLLIMVPILL